MRAFEQILVKEEFDRDDLVKLLSAGKTDQQLIFNRAAEVKGQEVENRVYFRGLIEFSNICSKNCLYCGIRSGNKNTGRYFMTHDEVLEAVRFAFEHHYSSIVLQSGERSDPKFVKALTELIEIINNETQGKLHITLSMGEQTETTYRQWMEAGTHRYLLRIEASNRELYKKLHPWNAKHDYQKRIDALKVLKKLGYQVGTGVMIGLPFQSMEDLADDLLFFKLMDVDMVGMGPYIEHQDTPLYKYKDSLLPLEDRFFLSLKMIALLRIMMKDINIAATTALQTIDPQGREKALRVGANVIMPNLTPLKYRDNYLLYEGIACLDEDAATYMNCLEARIHMAGDVIGYDDWGDSLHYRRRRGLT